MIQKEQIKYLNKQSIKDRHFVVYWMQSSQRTEYNHALEYAITRANDLEKPLLVYFGVTSEYKEANLRHYQFMIEGLKEVKEELKKRHIKMVVVHVSPEEGAITMSREAASMVVDRGYLRIERKWREEVAKNIDIPLVQIETNVIVPTEEVSQKEEYAAATIRNKINRLVPFYTKPFQIEKVEHSSLSIDLSMQEFDLDAIYELTIDRSVKPSPIYNGGTSEAKKWLQQFINHKLKYYAEKRNDPGLDLQSNLSPYLHFGQISPLYIYHQVQHLESEAFLEELIIRRELSMNFVYYNHEYDTINCLSSWAKDTLLKHQEDKREYLYTKEEFEASKTHDIYWNAAQQEMVATGKMNGYMRMYWGKKIIEWTNSPKEAYQIMIYLNNKYQLDGRDPNSFTGIAWCFGKHDRPWQERPIFGMVRYMNEAGLKRKFDMNRYIEKIEQQMMTK